MPNLFILMKRIDSKIVNNIEIKNMINAHIIDGVALTKFIYWIKNLRKLSITEVDAQNKLEKIRRMNPKY